MSRSAALTPSVVESIRHDPRYLEAQEHRGTRSNWRSRASCLQHDPELFFPNAAEDPTPALQVCRQCPVRGQCLAAALTAGEIEGVWGATTPEERRLMRRVWAMAEKLPATG